MAISHHGNDDWVSGYEEAEEPILRPKNNDRDVYELYRAIKMGTAPILVVDSVPNVDFARNLFPGSVVVTWTGTLNGSTHANWGALAARENLTAILLPSNNEKSIFDMGCVAGELGKHGFSIETISVSHMPEGWTISDEKEWTTADARRLYEEYREDFIVDAREVTLPEPVRAPQRDQGRSNPDDGFGEVIIPTDTPTHLVDSARKLLDDAKRDDTTVKMGHQGWGDIGMEMANGKPIPNVSNASLLLGSYYQDMVWYDRFLSRIRTRTADRKDTRDWTDADDIRITIEFQRRYGMAKISRDIVHQAIIEHAYRNIRNELTEWLEALPPWDGTERIEMFFIDCVGAKDTNYSRAVGRNFWVSLIARALRPGCKVDTMVILEGKQGKSKSTLLAVIGGRWYAIMAAAPDSNDFAITLAGKWVIEVAELHAFSKADTNSVKRTLRTASDRYRAPYGRHAEDHPRSSILAGSTNRDDYNLDDTGFRHGWPIECGDIRLDLVEANRDQLLAEAMQLFKAGATWWEMPAKETEMQQLQRYIGDPWETKVFDYIMLHSSVTIPDIMRAMHLTNNEMNRASQMRIAGILKIAGWAKVTEWDGTGKGSVRRWKREVS